MGSKKTGTVTGARVTINGGWFVGEWTPVKKSTDQRGWFFINGQSVNVPASSMTWDSGKSYKDMAKDTNSKMVWLNPAEYYPYTSQYLTYVGYGVSAKAKDKSWGDMSYFYTTIYPPNIPYCAQPSMYNNMNNTFTYSWSRNDADGDLLTTQYIFVDFVYETVLMDNGVAPDWSLAYGQTITILDPATGNVIPNQPSAVVTPYAVSPMSLVIVESQETLAANKVRYFRVKARGPGGDSPFTPGVYHVFGSAPKIDLNDKDVNLLSSDITGTNAAIGINVPNTANRPVDSVEYQYAITTPTVTVTEETDIHNERWKRSSLSLPVGYNSWTTYSTATGNGEKDILSMSISEQISENSCLFVRVNTIHDGITTTGTPMLVNAQANSIVNGAPAVRYELRPTSVQNSRPNADGTWSTSYSTNFVWAPVRDDIGAKERIYTPSLLSSPSISDVSADFSSHTVTITVSNQQGLPGSFIAVYYREYENLNPVKPIGIIPYGESSITVQAPAWKEGVEPTFGIRSFVADYTPVSRYASGVTQFTIDNIKMQSSEISWDNGSIPMAPTNFSVVRHSEGVAFVKWDWTWADANRAEVSWSDSDLAWDSNEEPSTYTLMNKNSGQIYITGLSAGTWYFKVRLIQATDDTMTYGAYSEMKKCLMSAAPNKPTLVLSTSVASLQTEVVAYWGYESNDGTAQGQAVIAEAIKNGNSWTYTKLTDAITNTETKFPFTPSDFSGWTEGSTHYLAVRVTSDSGKESEDWSDPVPLNIAGLPEISISGIGDDEDDDDALKPKTVDIGESDDGTTLDVPLALTKLPINFTVSGAGSDGTTSYSIRRVGPHKIDRPDESDIIGYDGETIISKTIKNSANSLDVTIENKDLLVPFDYKGQYRLDISITDRYGQTVPADPYFFTVYWDHFALEPQATINLDSDYEVAIITPEPINGMMNGDTCDIYRLSVDRPQLIGRDLVFGETYVDPYPTYGTHGGYRIVYKSLYGDTKTATNEYAWKDYSPLEDNLGEFSRFTVIIDFDDHTIELPGNVSLSNAWKKDFQLTRYLGGSMRGDWNYGVERTGSIKATVPVGYEPDTVSELRLLSDYSGICHVRTPEGSNFYANVDINEDRESKWVTKISTVTVSFTRVDNVKDDLILYSDWIN